MTLRRLEILQWVGLLLGAGLFTAEVVVGFGLTQARCGAGGARWGIDHTVGQAVLLALSALLVVIAQAASVGVLLGTRASSYESEPPRGRIRFFAIAALVANVLFLVFVVLAGVASIADVTCRQA